MLLNDNNIDLNLHVCLGHYYPDIKVHGANMGPTWGRLGPGGPHVGHVNLAIWVVPDKFINMITQSVYQINLPNLQDYMRWYCIWVILTFKLINDIILPDEIVSLIS